MLQDEESATEPRDQEARRPRRRFQRSSGPRSSSSRQTCSRMRRKRNATNTRSCCGILPPTSSGRRKDGVRGGRARSGGPLSHNTRPRQPRLDSPRAVVPDVSRRGDGAFGSLLTRCRSRGRRGAPRRRGSHRRPRAPAAGWLGELRGRRPSFPTGRRAARRSAPSRTHRRGIHRSTRRTSRADRAEQDQPAEQREIADHGTGRTATPRRGRRCLRRRRPMTVPRIPSPRNGRRHRADVVDLFPHLALGPMPTGPRRCRCESTSDRRRLRRDRVPRPPPPSPVREDSK